MLARPGSDHDLDGIDDGYLLSTLPDGWRCLVLLDDRVRVRSRAGHDLGAQLPSLVAALAKIRPARGASPTILDGILVLPPAADCPAPTLADVGAMIVLDALCVVGRDVTGRPLRERQALLRELPWPRDPALRFEPAWRGDARASLAQIQTSGTLTPGALLARRASSPYRPGVRAATWITFGDGERAEMLLCAIASSGALVLGVPAPPGIAFGGVTWPTRRWTALAARCAEGPPLFSIDALWPSLGSLTWARPDLWLTVTPEVRPGSARGGPRWRLLRVQEDLSSPLAAAVTPGVEAW